MKSITRLQIVIAAKDDHHALKLLHNLIKQLDATNDIPETSYSKEEIYGNMSATIERQENVPWGFDI